MRRSSYLLLIVVQLILLTIFSNSYALFKQLEKKSLSDFHEYAENRLQLLLSAPEPLKAILNEQLFAEVSIDQQILKSSPSSEKKTFLQKTLQDGRQLSVSVVIKWPVYSVCRQSKSLYANVSIFFLITLFITSLLFLFRLKKKDQPETDSEIENWQNYLQSLSQSQSKLEELVQTKEEHIQKQEELTFNLLNNIELGIVVVGRNKRIELINPTAREIFETSYALAKNTPAEEFFKNYPRLTQLITNPPSKLLFQEEICGRLCSLTALKMENSGLLILIEDITEANLRQKISENQSRFQETSEIATTIAHELKNSLNVILGYARIAREQPEKLEPIFKEIENLNQFIENFLHYTRLDCHPEFKQVEVSELISELEKFIQIPIKLSSEQSTIITDPFLLKQILQNLGLNARQAGANELRIEIHQIHRYLLIRISDNGCGIPPEDQKKIWLPFFTTRGSGSGLGLAIVNRLTSLLNGEIRLVHSSPQNTTFEIRLLKVEDDN